MTRVETKNGHTATYNLKAVVRETSLKPDTLRAWERRYGLPTPQRTSGGHRLYSQRDIDTLKWLIARQEEGLSISRAVDLWNQYLKKGDDPLGELPVEEPVQPANRITTGSTLVQMRDAWVHACIGFNEQSAESVVSQALAMFSPETICFQLLQKGLAQIGIGWYEGRISAQQEHFASALAVRRLESLLAGTPPPTRTGRILIGCAPDEEHTFSALLLTLLLRRRSWDALYLGANVPLARLEATIRATEPTLVILTAQTLHTAATLYRMAQVLEKESVQMAFGGLVFNSLVGLSNRIPGHFLGSTLEDSPNRIEQLIAKPSPYSLVNHANPAFHDLLNHFLERQAKLESIVWELMTNTGVPHSYLAGANRDFARCIIAALTLGDISFIGSDLHWVEGLLMNYNYRLPKVILHKYVDSYRLAAEEAMDHRGQMLIDWMTTILRS